MEQKGSLGAC